MRDRKAFDTIAHYLRTELFPCSDFFSQHVLLTLYRLIAKGSPVSLESLGAASGSDSGAVKEVLEQVAPSRLQNDEAGRIVAFAGLTQMPANHRFVFNGRELFTWCAFDTLFLPELLDGTARISSVCPVTGAAIGMMVSKDGLEVSVAGAAVMSFVMPDAENCCADLRGTFCNHVNFFASRRAGDIWLEHNPRAAILSLDDAFALGRINNHAGFKDVLAGYSGRLNVEPKAITSAGGTK
jgi:alkylmercury lyase